MPLKKYAVQKYLQKQGKDLTEKIAREDAYNIMFFPDSKNKEKYEK